LSVSFADLGVAAQTVESLRARSITTPSRVQSLAIPPALDGRDVCGRAPTGSGKTIAFAVPVAARVGRARPGQPTALLLAPTRELAAQIESEMALLLGPGGGRRVAAFYGGVGFVSQLRALRRGVDVAVACPGRLTDLIERGAIDLSRVSIVVIDEADRMADMGFLPEVKRILDQVRPDRQTLLFSATLDRDVDVLVQRYQHAPVVVKIEPDDQQSRSTSHQWIDARREHRVALAVDYVTAYGSTIVFCRTKHGADRVAKQLAAAGVKAVSLHGDRSQSQRERALAAFSCGRAQALVATDVAARGIHVDDVGCVVHFDLPATDKDYLHRSGRTGRAGAKGVVICFVTSSDNSAAKALQRALGHRISAHWASSRTTEVSPGGQTTPAGVAHNPARSTPATVASRPESRSRNRSDRSRRLRSEGSAAGKSPGSADRRTRPRRSSRRRHGPA
jgi:superfamily II DNA/RNA helicase